MTYSANIKTDQNVPCGGKAKIKNIYIIDRYFWFLGCFLPILDLFSFGYDIYYGVFCQNKAPNQSI